MLPDPLHPAVVHFPIVLVVLLPLVAIAAVVLIRRGGEVRTTWMPVVVCALALSGSAWLAVQTGEREEEAVEEVVAESAIHEHEEAAELFLPLSFAVLILTAGGLAKGKPGRVIRSVAPVAALLLAVAGYRVGHSGGELVYEHGAATAYAADQDLRASGERWDSADRDDARERRRDDRHD